ncbi:Inactive tyrosine-protein kinase transmembrane receptor ror1 [Branchiostoma belcheri]|nr:Inactive tyrosine-protein kinase transmembrane receptor ror1 [Branchiostoma belcheri]
MWHVRLVWFVIPAASRALRVFSKEGNKGAAPSLYLQLVEPMHNVTIGMGERAVLRCKVEGVPAPNFRWYKNDAPLTSERRRIQIRNYSWGSRLRIKKVDTHDTGYYRCVATNGQDRVSTQAILYVRYMAAVPGSFCDMGTPQASSLLR